MSFQPHESLLLIQPIPCSTSSIRSSNTWVNPNPKSVAQPTSQPSGMQTNSASQSNGQTSSTWIPDSRASFHVTGGES